MLLLNNFFFINSSLGVPLPRPLNDNGARIYFIKFEGDIAKGLKDLNKFYSVIMAMHEIMIMEDPYVCINGIIYIIDLKDITPDFGTKFSTPFLLKMAQFYEYSLPLYVKSINYINTPTFYYGALDIIKKLFSEKFFKRVIDIELNFLRKFIILKICLNRYMPMMKTVRTSSNQYPKNISLWNMVERTVPESKLQRIMIKNGWSMLNILKKMHNMEPMKS